MSRKLLFPALVFLFAAAFAVSAAAQEVIYIGEPSFLDTPRILPRFEAPVDRDFARNPALLTLECPYEFFSDVNYHGGTYKTWTGASLGPDGGGWDNSGGTSSSYYLHALGGDSGFKTRLGDSTILAALVSYRWGHLAGDTDFEYYSDWPGFIYGSLDERLNSHTVGLSLLVNHAFSDTFTLGAGIGYSYVTERLVREGAGSGEMGAGPWLSTVLIDRDYRLGYHRFAPVVGVLVTPSDRFTFDASLEVGFSFGRAGVESDLFSDEWFSPPDDTYSDDADSRDVFGWDVAAKVRPVVTVSEKLSVPLVLDFNYRQFGWEADGASTGYFGPVIYGGIFQGPGTIDYRNDTRSWDITAGTGLTHDAGWATLAGLLSYTHWDFLNEYDQDNLVPPGDPNAPGLTAYSQRDDEVRDTVSLGLMVERRFSPIISAAFGLKYDIGLGRRDYRTSYASTYELGTGATRFVSADDRDLYQDLTLTVGLTATPAERLTLALGGMVRFPLDSLDYDLDTVSTGWPLGGGAAFRIANDAPFSSYYTASGWEYGALLTLTYEFGCRVAAPPAAPEPLIEPKLEPMSSK